jgi:hypothetical protein
VGAGRENQFAEIEKGLMFLRYTVPSLRAVRKVKGINV